MFSESNYRESFFELLTHLLAFYDYGVDVDVDHVFVCLVCGFASLVRQKTEANKIYISLFSFFFLFFLNQTREETERKKEW